MKQDMCYAARSPGKPGYTAVCVDDPKFAKETAKDIARWIREGRTIERVTTKQAGKGMDEFLKWRKASTPVQAALI